MKRTILTRTIHLYVGQGGSQAATHPLRLLVLRSPPAADRSGLEQQVYTVRHYSVDKPPITHRLRLAITYGLMCRRSHSLALADQPAPPTGALPTAAH